MKVKISTNSGSIVEKAVLTAFTSGTGTYIVFDNESVGSMGLPIILVSKFVDNKVVKIQDNNEWNAVKESLRQLIAGNMTNYIDVPNEIAGDDNFFTQLTLPVASFDAIKMNYKPVKTETSVEQDVSDQQVATPGLDAQPTVIAQDIQTPVNPAVINPVSTPAVPVAENVASVETTPVAAPEVNVPQIDPSVIATPVENTAVEPASISPFTVDKPTPEVTAVNTEEETKTTENDFSAEKEIFLKSCANMFDVLVSKLNQK